MKKTLSIHLFRLLQGDLLSGDIMKGIEIVEFVNIRWSGISNIRKGFVSSILGLIGFKF